MDRGSLDYVAHVVRRFRLEDAEPGVPAVVAKVTLRPRDGLRMRLISRAQSTDT